MKQFRSFYERFDGRHLDEALALVRSGKGGAMAAMALTKVGRQPAAGSRDLAG